MPGRARSRPLPCPQSGHVSHPIPRVPSEEPMLKSNPVRNSTAAWQALDREHHLHPFTDTAALGRDGVRVITRAEGVYLWDSEGRRLIDGMAGLWCVNLGYGRKELAEAAYRQMLELPYYNN